MKTVIEEVANLVTIDKAQLFDLIVEAQKCQTVERLYNTATAFFGNRESVFQVFRGGHHLAVHLKSHPEARILLITEEKGGES